MANRQHTMFVVVPSLLMVKSQEIFANVDDQNQNIKIYGDFFGIEDVATMKKSSRVLNMKEKMFPYLKTQIFRYFTGIVREITETLVG